jgi:hypothetical protein
MWDTPGLPLKTFDGYKVASGALGVCARIQTLWKGTAFEATEKAKFVKGTGFSPYVTIVESTRL